MLSSPDHYLLPLLSNNPNAALLFLSSTLHLFTHPYPQHSSPHPLSPPPFFSPPRASIQGEVDASMASRIPLACALALSASSFAISNRCISLNLALHEEGEE